MAKSTYIADLDAKNAKYKKALRETETATKKASKKIESQFGKIKNSIKGTAGALSGMAAAWTVGNFIKDSIKFAARVEGVRLAFLKLNQPGLLSELRKATRNTVNDFELMQKAVQARNFKIPLDQLSTLLEFATKRAQQTGESVDYLVDSIITGIGRKSPMILDNLGISAAELAEEVKRVGDFGIATGNIVRQELQSMGNVMETTQTKLDRLSTSWENFTIGVGDFFITALDQIFYGGGISKDPAKNAEMIAMAAARGYMNALTDSREYIKEAEAKALAETSDLTMAQLNDGLDQLKLKYNALKKAQPYEEQKNDLAQLNARISVYMMRIEELKEKQKKQTESKSNNKQKENKEEEKTNEILKTRSELIDSILGKEAVNIRFTNEDDLEDINIEDDSEQVLDAALEKARQKAEAEWDAHEAMIQNLNAAHNLAAALQNASRAFNIDEKAQSALGIITSMIGMVSQITSIMNSMESGETSSTAGGLGIFTSIISMFTGFAAHSGGQFMNGKSVPSFAAGGTFQVPSGFPNDTFPMLVESGEKVTVESANSVQSQTKELRAIRKSIMAQTKTIKQLELSVNVSSKQDPKEFIKRGLKPNENLLSKNNNKMNSII